jgi:ribonuclease P protein component
VVVKGKVYLTKNEQYAFVYNNGGSWVNKHLVMKAVSNQLDISRYGFSVSKQIGNAVLRNRTKRLLREILRITPLRPGWDIIFIARKPVAGVQYRELEQTVKELLSRARILIK